MLRNHSQLGLSVVLLAFLIVVSGCSAPIANGVDSNSSGTSQGENSPGESAENRITVTVTNNRTSAYAVNVTLVRTENLSSVELLYQNGTTRTVNRSELPAEAHFGWVNREILKLDIYTNVSDVRPTAETITKKRAVIHPNTTKTIRFHNRTGNLSVLYELLNMTETSSGIAYSESHSGAGTRYVNVSVTLEKGNGTKTSVNMRTVS